MNFLSENDISDFEKNGAVCLRNVFSPNWIEKITKGITKNMANPSKFSESLKNNDSERGIFFNDYCNWTKLPEFMDYILNSPASEIAGTLTKSKYAAFYHEHVLVKEAGSFKKTPWHHDQSYYPIDGFKVCSIWTPIDYIPEDTCVQFIAGSHKWDWYYPTKFETCSRYEIKDTQNNEKTYFPVPDIDSDPSKYSILKWKLQPGDCIVFHMRTVHGAPGNLALDRSRRVLTTRWLGDDAIIAIRPWDTSPPTFGGLKPGDIAVSDEFPIIWRKQ